MSFILEALKKSEKKLEKTVVPNLHTVHGTSRPVPKHRPLWPYLLVAGLVLNAGVLLWFLAPRAQQPATPASVTSADSLRASPVVALPAVVEPPAPVPTRKFIAPPPFPVAVQPAPVVAQAEVPAAVATTSVLPLAEVPPPPALNVERSPALIETNAVEPRSEDRWEDEPPIYAVADLPYDVQSRLPEMNISVYAYFNDAASRMVRVNDRILREGNYLEAGLQLDEITPTGMVFTFDEYRFRVPKQ